MVARTQHKWIGVMAMLVATAATGATCSWAENPALWSISEATTGDDVFWTSPTAVDLGFPRYAMTFQFTRVEVFVPIFGGTDITDQLGEGTGTGITDALPVTLIDETFTEPTSGTSATVNVGIDASGFGQIAITEVVLGTYLFLPISRIEVDANLSVRGLVPGDFDGNLVVDPLDLALWESAYAASGAADTNFDGASNGRDFLEWQQFLGADFTTQSATSPVPEPQGWLLLIASLVIGARRAIR